VDLNGNVLTYNGSSWSTPDEIDTNHWLSSVSCPTTSFCEAVDLNGNVLTYNGSSWSSPAEIDPGTGQTLTSVSCPTTSFCAAVDLMGNVLTYQGSSWSSPESVDAGNWLESVSCPTASFCVAVDNNGNVLTYQGSSWSSPESLGAGNWLSSVSCPTASFCVAVDSYDAFTYSATVTLTQGTPTSASVADGVGYSGQLAATNANGTVTYTETSSADSGDVVVGSTGAITAATSLAPGTYNVGGTDSDTNGDTGTWGFGLTVNSAVVTPPRATVPGTPIKVSAKAGNASATLTWTAPSSDGGAAITGYVIKPSRGSAVKVGDVTSDTVTGLTNGNAYSFTVSAVNSVGTGPSSAVSNSVTPAKATSETSLKLSSKKVTYGDEQVEHLSVTVSPQHPGTTPTGTVTIKASATTLCVIKLASGAGSCKPLSARELNAGAYSLVATYSGSTNFKGSTSAKETLTVAK
jgi:hypothetical protein